MFSTSSPGTASPSESASRREPVVVVRLEDGGMHRMWIDRKPVLVLAHMCAEFVEQLHQRGDAISLVITDVRDPTNARRAVGQRSERGDGGRELTQVPKVHVVARDRAGAAHMQSGIVDACFGSERFEQRHDFINRLHARLRNTWDHDMPVRHERSSHEMAWHC